MVLVHSVIQITPPTAVLATPAAGSPSSTGPWCLTYFGAPKIATVFHRTTNDFNPKESS